MNWKTLFSLVAAFILYLVIGALVFSALEAAQEEKTRVDLRRYKEALLSNLTCLSEDSLENLIRQVMYAVDSGLNPLLNVSGNSNWDFSSSFFFSGTVVTTIGYGNLSPTTSGGQAFCIIYALIGIPLFGILMAAISEKLKKHASCLEKKLDDRCPQHPKIKSVVSALMVLAMTLLFFMVIPAIAFSAIEKWTFFESFYYTFITLTTIGFGDFVIGTNQRIHYHVLYKWCSICWIIIGLAALALIIAYISEALTGTADKIQQRHEEMMKRRNGEEAESEDAREGKEEGKEKTGLVGDGNSGKMMELREMSGDKA